VTAIGGWPLAASTLGAPGVPLGEVLSWIRAAGGTAAELRLAAGDTVHPGLGEAGCAAVRALLADHGVSALSVASYVRVAAAGPDDVVLAELTACLDLAQRVGARFVRVFPGAALEPGPPGVPPRWQEQGTDVDGRAVRRLAAAAAMAAARGVRLVLETHDSHPRGADVARVLDRLGEVSPGHEVGAVWDALHPWRTGEVPGDTAGLLRPYLAGGRGYVQVKDVASREDLTPVLPGQGVLPLAGITRLLAPWYRGPLSLEWERAWYPAVPALPVALAAATQVL
jgi:sugar phosphate isomerase/epimerase